MADTPAISAIQLIRYIEESDRLIEEAGGKDAAVALLQKHDQEFFLESLAHASGELARPKDFEDFMPLRIDEFNSRLIAAINKARAAGELYERPPGERPS